MHAGMDSKADLKTGPPSSEAANVGDHVKSLEARWDAKLPSSSSYVIRLDGHAFSKFTRHFRKPLDARITQSMVSTTVDLLNEFNAVCGFTQSDEITLVFPAANTSTGQPHIFSGRVQKLASLTSSFASIRFHHHLTRQEYTAEEADLRAIVADRPAYFDARVFATPSPQDAMLAVYWRHRYDCYRNGVSSLAQCHFSHRQLDKKGTSAKLKMLADKGVYLKDEPAALAYGTFVKREKCEVKGYDPKSGEETVVSRTRAHFESFSWEGTQDERTEFVFRKYWKEVSLEEAALAPPPSFTLVGRGPGPAPAPPAGGEEHTPE